MNARHIDEIINFYLYLKVNAYSTDQELHNPSTRSPLRYRLIFIATLTLFVSCQRKRADPAVLPPVEASSTAAPEGADAEVEGEYDSGDYGGGDYGGEGEVYAEDPYALSEQQAGFDQQQQQQQITPEQGGGAPDKSIFLIQSIPAFLQVAQSGNPQAAMGLMTQMAGALGGEQGGAMANAMQQVLPLLQGAGQK